MANNILRNSPFCSFASILVFLLKSFINKPDSSKDLNISMLLFISSLEIINAVLRDPKIFLWIAASVADAAAVYPNGIKTLLANGLTTFTINGNLVFSNGPKSLPKNPPVCFTLCSWTFNDFILADELFVKALRILENMFIS